TIRLTFSFGLWIFSWFFERIVTFFHPVLDLLRNQRVVQSLSFGISVLLVSFDFNRLFYHSLHEIARTQRSCQEERGKIRNQLRRIRDFHQRFQSTPRSN